jgi:alkanesulfonate monooxygenase SsuD/methylene tetrahydromethanopterin reductase-like flavin-dependent oxidoreductase (luciferase family)
MPTTSAGDKQEALDLYRSQFIPSVINPEPQTLLTVTAVVAPSLDEAEALFLPVLRTLAFSALDHPRGRFELVEDAQEAEPPLSWGPAAVIRSRAIVAAPDQAADELRGLAARYDVDEIMVCSPVSERRGTHPWASPAREATLELLAKELL